MKFRIGDKVKVTNPVIQTKMRDKEHINNVYVVVKIVIYRFGIIYLVRETDMGFLETELELVDSNTNNEKEKKLRLI